MDNLYVVVDIGGTGTRLALANGSGITALQRAKLNSMHDLVSAIHQLTNRAKPYGVAIAVPGIVNPERGTVRLSRSAPWLEGNLAVELKTKLGLTTEKVFIVNDGEAHTLALRRHPKVKFGAINFALGTSVAFGAIDVNGNTIRSLSGENWEIGDFELNTRSSEKALWHCLGHRGFEELSRWTDADGIKHFGYRLGKFAAQMSIIFRPNTVGLSGGIIRHNWPRIEKGFREEFSNLKKLGEVVSLPNVVTLEDEEPALIGLASLFRR